MDAITFLVTQNTALIAAVRALIKTHPDRESFDQAFSALSAQALATTDIIASEDRARNAYRDLCDLLARPS